MLAGRGLTCMKRWALGEEFSTIRFTMLMSVSLSLICSRGRNGQFTQPWLWLPPQTPLWLSAGNRGGAAALGCLRPPDLGLRHFSACELFLDQYWCPHANVTAGCREATGPSPAAWKRSCKAQGLCPGVPGHTGQAVPVLLISHTALDEDHTLGKPVSSN